MTQMNSKDLRLQELFSNKSIVKVFHDCIEDLSLLYNLCNIKDIKGIFDTQIAHRMCCDDPSYKGVKNSAISLAMLIKVYLNIEYEIKGEMHNLMAQNPYLWKTRPLTEKLNFYAGNDVIYLPKIFYLIKEKCERHQMRYLTMERIFEECSNYVSYVKMNLSIKNFHKMNLAKGSTIQGLIK